MSISVEDDFMHWIMLGYCHNFTSVIYIYSPHPFYNFEVSETIESLESTLRRNDAFMIIGNFFYFFFVPVYYKSGLLIILLLSTCPPIWNMYICTYEQTVALWFEANKNPDYMHAYKVTVYST